MPASHGRSEQLSWRAGVPAANTTQQQTIDAPGVGLMMGDRTVYLGKCPAGGMQPGTEFQFLGAVKVTVSQIADRLDRRSTIKAGAVEPRDMAGPVIRVMPLASLFIFL